MEDRVYERELQLALEVSRSESSQETSKTEDAAQLNEPIEIRDDDEEEKENVCTEVTAPAQQEGDDGNRVCLLKVLLQV